MAKHRASLPQLTGEFFLTDGGIETTLIFLEGQDLPHFAAFHLLQSTDGEGVLRKYFLTYAELKRRQLKHLSVMGGCCGTDDRHVEQIALSCLPLFRQSA
ncbi:MAG: hypothetical protein IT349_09600 [Candidatus Eisenbacteria bacterium]|nr:hypothetical protein [Candidatus Eisenbacteria bacterium]